MLFYSKLWLSELSVGFSLCGLEEMGQTLTPVVLERVFTLWC